MKIRNEIKVGVVILAGIALLIYGYHFLSGSNLFSKERQFYAVYNQVESLTVDNIIQLNGFKVGKVNQMHFLPDNSGRIVVGFILQEPTIKLPKNTVARIISLDLLGSKAISLELGDSAVYYQVGDTLKSSVQLSLQESVNEQVRPLKQKAEQLIASMDSAVVIVQTVLNKNARENLSASFESIKRAITTFEKTSLRLDTLISTEKVKIENIFTNVESITGNIKENNEQLTTVINNFASISDSLVKADLASTIRKANKVLTDVSRITEKINRGEGTMGMLIHNDSLYRNLERSTYQIDKLLEDMTNNPHKYVHISLIDFHRDKEKKKKKNR